MPERKSPEKSATLYKIGTKKKGNDGNTWIIVENKNNIKKWQLYKKIQNHNKNDTKKNSINTNNTKKSSINTNNTKKSSRNIKKNSRNIKKNDTKESTKENNIISNNDTKKISLDKLYDNIYNKPIIKKNNWNKWLENCDNDLINFINKIRNSYKVFDNFKIKVVEVIEPPSSRSHWIEQYPYDFAKKNFPQYYKDENNIVPHIIIRYKIDNDENLVTEYTQKCIWCSILNITETIKNKITNYLDINFSKQYVIKNVYENDYLLIFCLKNPNKK